ncbi:MAG TPA: Rrf2 family transcriptional regulator [Ktedonobacterales bacterium]|jgi:Rrf2 family protein|nr:Rrf2 family transcriptional regulator [Ktedonobacterales bacterium]
MKLTMKSDYGLRAMIDLAQHYGKGPIQCSDIAQRQDIPEYYLDQLLICMRKAGLIRSVRGPQGGHLLAKLPTQIMMGEVIQALDGSLSPMECVPDPGSCSQSSGCAMRQIWLKVDEYTQQLVMNTTIEDLAKQHHAASAELMYEI